MIKTGIVLLCIALGTSMAIAQEEPPTRDIPYADTKNQAQTLDIYLPKNAEPPYPTVIFLGGNRDNKANHRAWGEHFAEEGYAAVMANYRTFPARHTDGFCATAWVHANADTYNFDPDYIFIMGWSSGGGMAAEIGTIDPEIDPFEDECSHSIPEQWVAGTILLAAGSEKWPESGWRTDMEPLTWLDGTEAPFLLIHGVLDEVIPVEDSEQLATALEEMEIPFDLLILPEAGHLFVIEEENGRSETWEAVDSFLEKQLRPSDEP